MGTAMGLGMGMGNLLLYVIFIERHQYDKITKI